MARLFALNDEWTNNFMFMFCASNTAATALMLPIVVALVKKVAKYNPLYSHDNSVIRINQVSGKCLQNSVQIYKQKSNYSLLQIRFLKHSIKDFKFRVNIIFYLTNNIRIQKAF